jgi:hypothetical protein
MTTEGNAPKTRKVMAWLIDAVGLLIMAVLVWAVGTWLGLDKGAATGVGSLVICGAVVLSALPEYLRPWPTGRHKRGVLSADQLRDLDQHLKRQGH